MAEEKGEFIGGALCDMRGEKTSEQENTRLSVSFKTSELA